MRFCSTCSGFVASGLKACVPGGAYRDILHQLVWNQIVRPREAYEAKLRRFVHPVLLAPEAETIFQSTSKAFQESRECETVRRSPRHYACSAGEFTEDFGDARIQVTERVDDASFQLCGIRTKVVIASISSHEGKRHVREGKISSPSVGAKIH